MQASELNGVPAWRISYRYVNPTPGGPFRGRMVVYGFEKPSKGDVVPAMFGRAAIKTVSRVREKRETVPPSEEPQEQISLF